VNRKVVYLLSASLKLYVDGSAWSTAHWLGQSWSRKNLHGRRGIQ